jgi:alpha-beta hydrolase superfamily lysophospholipase
LAKVKNPTLLLVGGMDTDVIALNKQAMAELTCEKELKIIPGATHLFEEPGTLDQVCDYATKWFMKYVYWKSSEVEKDFLE